MTVAVCVRDTFQSVHIAIETFEMHSLPLVLNQVYGAGSLATFKGDYGTVLS